MPKWHLLGPTIQIPWSFHFIWFGLRLPIPVSPAGQQGISLGASFNFSQIFLPIRVLISTNMLVTTVGVLQNANLSDNGIKLSDGCVIKCY